MRLPKALPYALVIAILYMIMAMFAIVSPNAVLLWMQANSAVHIDAFVIVLSVAAAILISRPTVAWFILCLIPLAFYMAVSVLYTGATPSTSMNTPVVTMYAIIIVGLPLAYKLCRADGIQLYHVYGVGMVGMSAALLSTPAVATLQFIQSEYGIASVVAIAALLLCALLLLLFPSKRMLTLLIALIMLYSSITALVALRRGNVVGTSVNMILFATVFYTAIKRRHYFPAQTNEQ